MDEDRQIPATQVPSSYLQVPYVAPRAEDSLTSSQDVANSSGTSLPIVVANPASVSGDVFQKSPATYRSNMKDKPKEYVGRRRADTPRDSKPSAVYLGIETVEGLGDSVLVASMDYNRVVERLKNFAAVLGEEIYADTFASHTLAGQRLRTKDGKLSAYKISVITLS
jgi:hypothetical protein